MILAYILIFLSLFLSLGLADSQEAIEHLTSQDLYLGIQDGRFDVVIDVRSIGEWEAGHIDGATFMEDLNKFGTSSEKSSPSDLEGCEDCTIVVYCRSGARAQQAANILRNAGFKTPIYNGRGVSQWQQAGYTLSTTPSVVAPCQEGLSCSGAMKMLTIEEFYDGIQDNLFDAIVDIRSIGEWESGHIEGATFMEDLNTFGTSSEKSSPDDLAGCEECTIVVYCRSGNRANTGVQILADAGFKTPIYNGLGVSQWQEAGYSLVNTAPTTAPCQQGFSCSGETPSEAPVSFPEGAICFSGQSTVEILGKGTVPMREVQVGDKVKVEGDRYERVYTFGHRDESISATYLHFSPSLLEISLDHMVFVENRGALPASKVEVGDVLVNGVVKAIREVKRTGAFAPFTPSGTIIVNGVLSSNYIAFQGSPALKVGSIETQLTYQWVAHAFTAPLRIWSNCCGGSSGDTEAWLSLGYKAFTWLLRQEPFMIGVVFVPIIVILLLFVSFEFVGSHFVAIAACIIFWIASRRSLKRI